MSAEFSLPSVPSSALFRCISPSCSRSSPSALGAICFAHSAEEQVEQFCIYGFTKGDHLEVLQGYFTVFMWGPVCLMGYGIQKLKQICF